MILPDDDDLGRDRRDVYLQRIEAMLKLRRRFDDRDVAEVAALAACGLVHRTDAA